MILDTTPINITHQKKSGPWRQFKWVKLFFTENPVIIIVSENMKIIEDIMCKIKVALNKSSHCCKFFYLAKYQKWGS